MRTAAILPVKRFAEAKSRLGPSLADPQRAQLARAMVGDVLLALAQTDAIELTIVVSCEQSLLEVAAANGALVVPDSEERGQSAAVSIGVRRALAEGMQRVLCIPGDCPALDPAELQELLSVSATGGAGDASALGGGDAATLGAAHASTPGAGDAVVDGDSDSDSESEVVIVPDRHGTGTNGLLLTPPEAIEPSFGPGSCERHRALARAAGASCRLAHPSSLLLDIDTGADLAALRERLAGTSSRAVGTRAALGRPERKPILSSTNTGR